MSASRSAAWLRLEWFTMAKYRGPVDAGLAVDEGAPPAVHVDAAYILELGHLGAQRAEQRPGQRYGEPRGPPRELEVPAASGDGSRLGPPPGRG